MDAQQFAESILEDMARDCEGDPKTIAQYWKKIKKEVEKRLLPY